VSDNTATRLNPIQAAAERARRARAELRGALERSDFWAIERAARELLAAEDAGDRLVNRISGEA
jgi:hypothetical protein